MTIVYKSTPEGRVAMTAEETAEYEIMLAQIAAEAPSRNRMLSIWNLESSVTPRRIREAALTQAGKDWLADVDAQIAALRAQL
jgi:hypothetical protein